MKEEKAMASAGAAGGSASVSGRAHWSTRQLVMMALLCAVGVLLSFIEFPLLPGMAWLKYDASAMPAAVCGFAFGPGAGVAVGIVGAIIHGMIMADFWGAIMNILAVTCFVLPAAALYSRRRTFGCAVLGLGMGVVAATGVSIAANLVITPLYLGMPIEAVYALIPALIPFNLVKTVLNSVLTLAVHRSVAGILSAPRKQVKGR